MSKKGLIMEGGAMRGMFTAGVIDVFMEEGIDFDGAIGVSAGATFGCNIKSKQIGRAFRYNTKYCHDYRYGSFKSWIKSGDLFDVDFCYREIPEELDLFDTDTFTKNPLEFYVVASDLKSGEAAYHKCCDGKGKDLSWIQASASLPMVSRIVEIDGGKYLDGGIADSIPVMHFREIGYDKNVVILTRADSYVKKKNQLSFLCKLIYRKYPKFCKSFADRHIRYNECIEEIRRLEKAGEIMVIRPDAELGIKKAEKNIDELTRVYEEGRRIATRELEKVRAYLDA